LRSTFVKVLILTARNVDYHFHDTGDEMYLPVHLERHPLGACWRSSMTTSCAMKPNVLPSVVRFNAKLPPRHPIEHARVGTPSS
jgi:hypothetical protein